MGFADKIKEMQEKVQQQLKEQMEKFKGKIPGLGKKSEVPSPTASVEQAGGGKRTRKHRTRKGKKAKQHKKTSKRHVKKTLRRHKKKSRRTFRKK